MWDIIYREIVFIWYYSEIQFKQIAFYWALGIVIGSIISVFGKNKIHSLMTVIQEKHLGVFGIIPASLIGIASPLCMYGTIPIAASFSQKGMRDDYLAAFMITGPATKITNLGALKIVLGIKHFIYYLLFVMAFALRKVHKKLKSLTF